MIALAPGSAQAERSLARRDTLLPGLPWLLDSTRLSELLGETVRVTRVRYKPGTSLLVAYRRLRNGNFEYGWATTRTPSGAGKLLERERTSRTRGGDMRILRPDPGDPDTVVAVGGVEDDWALQKNLTWLRSHGAGRLGLHTKPGSGVLAGSSVLRYKPERRLVLFAYNASSAVVIKTAAKPAGHGQQPHFLDRLRRHGVPLLPQLADAECLSHGVSASTAWGAGDLAAHENAGSRTAYAAGQALAALHCAPAGSGVAGPVRHPAAGGWREDHAAQLKATRGMVSLLVPDLERLARHLETRLAALLLDQPRTAPVLVHGDFSPDQVLMAGSEVRLIDFDRAGMGLAEADLGSFAAAEEAALPVPDGVADGAPAGGPKTAQLAEGYLDAGGRFSQAAVDAWAACRLFNSSVDPFRDRSQGWAADMTWQLSRAKELIS
ncbi:phosphotransferase family protein [Arthrobacter sp. NPDC056727]|uniref:phosphotransferase family protein n=1 Tax=Arthrobacter sp. NPDC056727 TaxID=3345927 RepID=UPI00366DB298